MDEITEDVKKSIEKYSENLARLGSGLSEIQFNYRVLDKNNSKYWEDRLEHFKKYHQKGIEYYTQVHLIMNIVEKEKAGLFLLNLSKLRQLGRKLLNLLEQIKENPSVMHSKDKQQSKWSKELREQLIECSDKNLNLEKDMNDNFREFYEKHLRNL